MIACLLKSRFRPSPHQFPIIVSQDCGHDPTTRVIQSYGDQLTLIQVSLLVFPHQFSNIRKNNLEGYNKQREGRLKRYFKSLKRKKELVLLG